jgi:hypothetical protein
MKKIFLIVLVALSISALGYSRAHAFGAVVVKGEQCVIETAASGLAVPLFTSNTHEQITPSGVANLICIFNIKGNEPSSKIENTGFSCDIPGAEVTEDTRFVATPGGRAVLTCRYNPHIEP